MKKIFFLFCLTLPLSKGFYGTLLAQKSARVTVEISSDTVGLDGMLEVTFTVENAKVKKFSPPAFDGFDAQGPSTSMMTSFVNGEMSQKASYTFYLTPTEKGTFTIGAASFVTEGVTLSSDEQKIVVVEKYEGTSKKRKRNNMWDNDDDFFFRRQQMPPIKERQPEKAKKNYQTERI